MSNYIMLIVDTYNEKEKKDKSFHPKINLFDFYKKNTKMVAILIIEVISIISYIIFTFIKVRYHFLYSVISIIIYSVILIILIPLSDKAVQKNSKRNLEAYDSRLEILRKILKGDFKLYESRKIQELIKQCDLSIEVCELSTQIFKPLVNVTKSVLFPIITFSFGLIINKVEINLNDTIIITMFCIMLMLMVLGLFYILKHSVESFLNSQSNKIKRLKGMLSDMLIKDFIKEEAKL